MKHIILVHSEFFYCVDWFFGSLWIKRGHDMIFKQKFTLAQMGEVLNKNPSTLRTHINRGYVVAAGPRNKDGDKETGKHSRFSFFTLMQFAMAYKLADLGVQNEAAFKAAADFAHVGGGGEVFGLPERLPAIPFHQDEGETIFGMTTVRTFEELWKRGENYDTYGKLARTLNSYDFVTVNASDVFNHVCGAIGEHPYTVLDQVYGKTQVKAD